MKKMIMMLAGALFVTVFAINTASAQPPHAKAYGHHKFYYYPERNVYYDPYVSRYYYSEGTTWSASATLPGGLTLSVGSPKVIVYHDGPEVWYDNPVHIVKYKEYRYKPNKHWKHNKHWRRDD